MGVLGATGSVGRQALEVIAAQGGRWRVETLAANHSDAALFEQCQRFQPRFAALADEAAAERLAARIRGSSLETVVEGGPQAVIAAAEFAGLDTVVAGISGTAGLPSVLAAIRRGLRVLLANKEALVSSGAFMRQQSRAYGAQLLPLDSEHNAVMQCLPAAADAAGGGADAAFDGSLAGVAGITLTASGGPFLRTPLDRLNAVSPQEACRHPTWNMGAKISVDSATLMNKGLEVIEAHWLFGLEAERISVLIHPQSVVHSLVSYVDGSTLAQLSAPDMRIPIAVALAWPQRLDCGLKKLDLAEISQLDFAEVDRRRFPCLEMAYSALRAGGGAPAVLSAANEEAVSRFLAGRIAFSAIAAAVEYVLERTAGIRLDRLEDIDEVHAEGRRQAIAYFQSSNSGGATHG